MAASCFLGMSCIGIDCGASYFFTLFGRRIIENFRLSLEFHREVYIIKGSGKHALMLGENIATCDNPQKPPVVKRLILFLIEENGNIKEINEKTNHFGGIVRMLDKKNSFQYYLKKTGLGEWRQRFIKTKYFVILINNALVADDAHLVAKYAKEKNVNEKKP